MLVLELGGLLGELYVDVAEHDHVVVHKRLGGRHS
jgi:hypothetical protein